MLDAVTTLLHMYIPVVFEFELYVYSTLRNYNGPLVNTVWQ